MQMLCAGFRSQLVHLAYQPATGQQYFFSQNKTCHRPAVLFLSEQTSHQQPASGTLLSEQTSRQPTPVDVVRLIPTEFEPKKIKEEEKDVEVKGAGRREGERREIC
jgi:hypothetical protein